MIELRWIYVQGMPKGGDILVGHDHVNIWQRLQYRQVPDGKWIDVPMGAVALAPPPGDE